MGDVINFAKRGEFTTLYASEKQNFIEEVRSVLSEEDWLEFLEALVQQNVYRDTDDDIRDLVDQYNMLD